MGFVAEQDDAAVPLGGLEVADRIVADFDLALVARQALPRTGGPGREVSQRRSAGVRFRPAMPVSSLSPGSSPVPGRLVRLGQVIPLRAEPAGGEVYLLSYAQTEPGHQLSLFVRSTRQVVDPVGTRGEDPGAVHRHRRPGDPLPDDGPRPRRRRRRVDPPAPSPARRMTRGGWT